MNNDDRQGLSAAVEERIDFLKSYLPISHGLDRSDLLKDLASYAAIFAAAQASDLRHLINAGPPHRPIGVTLHYTLREPCQQRTKKGSDTCPRRAAMTWKVDLLGAPLTPPSRARHVAPRLVPFPRGFFVGLARRRQSGTIRLRSRFLCMARLLPPAKDAPHLPRALSPSPRLCGAFSWPQASIASLRMTSL